MMMNPQSMLAMARRQNAQRMAQTRTPDGAMGSVNLSSSNIGEANQPYMDPMAQARSQFAMGTGRSAVPR